MKLRARAEADKTRRNDSILKAGREIWSRRPWEFTMTEVADRAGIVKGTVYLYFATKEDLLAAISERMLGEYLDGIDRALESRKRWTLAKVAALFSDGMHLPMLPHNERTRERIGATAELIDARVPGLRRGDSLRFVLCAAAMLTGFGSMNVRGELRHGMAALAQGMEKRR